MVLAVAAATAAKPNPARKDASASVPSAVTVMERTDGVEVVVEDVGHVVVVVTSDLVGGAVVMVVVAVFAVVTVTVEGMEAGMVAADGAFLAVLATVVAILVEAAVNGVVATTPVGSAVRVEEWVPAIDGVATRRGYGAVFAALMLAVSTKLAPASRRKGRNCAR